MDEAISRQAAIDALKKQREELLKGLDKNSNVYGIISASMGIVICTVGQLPSAQPTFDARDTQYNLPIGTDLISRAAAIDALRKMQTYKLFSGDDMLLIDQAGAQTELMLLPSSKPQIIRCRDCVNYKGHRCTVANHYVSEKESCAEVFGAKRREVTT